MVSHWCHFRVDFLPRVRGAFLTIPMFPLTDELLRDIAVVSILILSWADTAASTIGRLWGRYTPPLPRRIPYIGLKFAPRKSTAGYAAAFLMGGVITAVFLGSHAMRTSSYEVTMASSLPSPSWSELSASSWSDIWAWVMSCTNFDNIPVSQASPSWRWDQRVGGGWPGLAVLGLWSGFVTAISEAMGTFSLPTAVSLCSQLFGRS